MARRRMARLNEQLRREIAEILHREVKDPRVEGVVVTGAEAAPDLTTARVYVTLPGGATGGTEALDGLRAAAPFIRGELGRRLRVRRVPELRFLADRSLEHAMRIERLLDEALPERRGTGAAEPGDEEDGEVDAR
ncbi:MAG TPA: 30S ribosome-binding factor RbfA [Longimicrobiales bacterium]